MVLPDACPAMAADGRPSLAGTYLLGTCWKNSCTTRVSVDSSLGLCPDCHEMLVEAGR